MIDDYSPILKGDTLKPFAPQLLIYDPVQDKVVPMPLSGLTATLTITSFDGLTVKGGGPMVIDDAANGKLHYQYQSTDVDTQGTWKLYIKLTNSSNQVVHAETKTLEIEWAP